MKSRSDHSHSKNSDFAAATIPPFDPDNEVSMYENGDEDDMESDSLVHESPAEYDVYVVEESSREYIGQWNRLISRTNWEKGQLISEWRASMVFSGAPTQLYSDDAWSRRVGNVSGQHVSRLRRVYDRFSQTYEQYPGLYWSHFQAALDWEDAEVWLEGAIHQRWSVSQMRNQRWVAIGAPPECKPRDEDVVLSELDEDVTAALDSRRLSGENGTADLNVVMPAFGEEPGRVSADGVVSGAARGGDFSGDFSSDAKSGGKSSAPPSDAFGEKDFGDSDSSAGSSAILNPHTAPVMPADVEAGMQESISPTFAGLPPLPEDVEEVFESFKIAILNHKLAKWTRISRTEMLRVLEALKTLCD